MGKRAVTESTNIKKVYLQSLGCPKNLVDSEIMLGNLASQGYELTTDKSDAEVIIVNTCGFLQASAKESIDTILNLAREKEAGSCKKLVVTGCLSQRYAGKLPQEMPEVDLFIGTNDYPKIAEYLTGPGAPSSPGGAHSVARRRGAPSGRATRFPDSEMPQREYIHKPLYIHTSNTPRLLATASHTAYVKIAEGCNHTCSFCIIPQLRGKQRSRPIADIRREIEALITMGVKEFNLIAQDTTDYGCDLHDGTTIEKLFGELSEIRGDHWYRLMYAYPLRFSDELIARMADSANFCRYVDIPFQHISDRILKSMRRGSNGSYIRSLIERLRKKIPSIAIRSTFIVGYPGESEEEFGELLQFLKEAELDRVGVFAYSPEEGTAAFNLPGPVPEAVQKERVKRLMTQQQAISLKKTRQKIGQTIRVLVEKSNRSSSWGRSEWDAPEIDGKINLTGGSPSQGTFCAVLITGASTYDLTGQVLDYAPQ